MIIQTKPIRVAWGICKAANLIGFLYVLVAGETPTHGEQRDSNSSAGAPC
jgi:hypothetical protein